MTGPAQVWPLARYLCEEMIERGWQTQDVAVRMGATDADEMARDLLEIDLIMCIHKENCMISDETFAKLGRAFGVSADLFKNLDASWRQWPDRREPFEPPESIFGEASQNSIPASH